MEDNRPNLDYQEDSEAPDNVVSAASLMAKSSNSNVFDANDSMALNESSIQNVLKRFGFPKFCISYNHADVKIDLHLEQFIHYA